MKYLLFIITLFFGISVFAQEEFKTSKTFVRVYNWQGKKINKGKVFKVTDTTLVLKRNKELVKIPVSNIGSIKTKRSAGNNILIGATAGAILGATSGEEALEETPGFGVEPIVSGLAVIVGVISGATTGAAIGGITILFKNSKSYEISGDEVKWKAFTKMIIK